MDAILAPFAYILSFLFVFTIVVFVHEMGHFWTARFLGFKIDAFSIGVGPAVIKTKDKYGTIWKICSYPLGGYVKFTGDEGAASVPDEKKLDELRNEMKGDVPDASSGIFHFMPLWRRTAVVAAGPLANFIFAIFIFSAALFIFGAERLSPTIGRVLENTVAERAGFQSGDEILKVNGENLKSFHRLAGLIQISANDPIDFVVDRGGVNVAITATPEAKVRDDPFGKKMKVGYLGFESRDIRGDRIQYGLIEAVGEGTDMTAKAIGDQIAFVARLFRGSGSAEMLGGPMRIFFIAGKVGADSPEATEGQRRTFGQRLLALILLSGSLSVAIGLINLAPIPVLDGGHLVFYAYEGIMGRPMSERLQIIGFKVGFSAILCLLAFATFNDLRYFNVFEMVGSLFS